MRALSWKLVLAAAVAVLAAVALAAWRRGGAPALAAPLANAGVTSFRVEFGLTDKEARAWDGTLSVRGGEILALRNWRPRPGDKIDGKSGWSLQTRRGPNFVRRAWEEEPITEPVPYLWTPGLVVDVKGGAATRVSFETRNGSFEVDPSALPARLLGGAVVAERVPTAELLSAPDAQNDFAAALALPEGQRWVAWVAYANKQNRILARRFDGKAWSAAREVTEKPGDIFLVKLGRDGKGGVWAVWSEQTAGNWDLYARRFGGQSWSAVERLTSDPQPDIYHNLATDSAGNLWVVWQGFRNGRSDVFARRWDGAGWTPEERVSTSPANDWEPAIAADHTGRVWVAWDTYDQGNYDVLLRRFEGGKWAEPVALASTPKFEAHVSLACDDQNRVWAAWNESGMQWGKDAGFTIKKEATRLYQSRSVAVAVWTPAGLMQPAADFDQSMPAGMRSYNDLPTLVADGAGRIWLFFRHRMLRIRDVHNNTPAHRAAWEVYASSYSGGRWSAPVAVPFSQGRQDMRAGYAADGRGGLYACWPTDNRDYEEFLFERAEVYSARIPTPTQAAEPAKLVPRTQPKLDTWPAHENEAADLKRIRGYEIRSEGATYHIYRGDVHRHTEFSMDGNNDGSLQECYRYAIDAAELDFLGVSDHNGMGGPDVEYINYLMQQTADLFRAAGRFEPLYAYERSVGYPNGHRNVVFARRGNPTLPIPPAEQKAKSGARSLYDYLTRRDGVAISHTSASNMGTDWRDNDPVVEPLVEIFQGDRVSAEYEGAPKAAHAGNPGSAPGGFRPAGYVWNAWAKGYRLGVQCSSDHLSTHLSYACTLATDFSREGLVSGMKKRHSYGATDNIVLDYRLQTGGREYLQGDIVQAAGDFKLVVKVIGTTPIRQIDVIRNNTFIHNRQPLEREVSFTFADTQPLTGNSYYYVRVIQADDNMAWSSPIWITRP